MSGGGSVAKRTRLSSQSSCSRRTGNSRLVPLIALVLMLCFAPLLFLSRTLLHDDDSVLSSSSSSVTAHRIRLQQQQKNYEASLSQFGEFNQTRFVYTSDQLPLPRGVVVNITQLTQSHDCIRLSSWRANEKRYIRLQNDRLKVSNCIGESGLTHSQLFGLRVSYDQDFHDPMLTLHEKDPLPPDESMWYRAAREYVHRTQRTAASQSEIDRVYSLVMIATSPVFQWLTAGEEEPQLNTGAGAAVAASSSRRRHHTVVQHAGRSAPMGWNRNYTADNASQLHRDETEDGTPFSTVLEHFSTVEELIVAKRLMIVTSSGPGFMPSDAAFVGRVQLNLTHLARCHFVALKPLSHFDRYPFAREGYYLTHFLWTYAFAKYGWVTMPIAGTALGTLRHRGGFRGDDDLDMLSYPPAQYLYHNASWESLFDDFDELVETYSVVEGTGRFQWFRMNDYRKYGPWYTRKDAEKHLPSFPFVEYETHITQSNRVCFAQYATMNITEKRRLFLTEGCLPNHWFLCLQPSTYLYDLRDEVVERSPLASMTLPKSQFYGRSQATIERYLRPHRAMRLPSMFTAYRRRPLAPLCRASFGAIPAPDDFDWKDNARETESFIVASENLVDMVQYWYDDKWCVSSGAVRTRKWSFLKSWND